MNFGKWVLMALAAIAVIGIAMIILRTGESPSATDRTDFTIAESPVKRCINLGGALEASNEGDWGYRIRVEDFALIKATGFDTVRIPVKWSAHARTDTPYTIDGLFLARVDTVVNQALARDLNVIIDVHHYDELATDPAGHLPRLYAIWDQLFLHFAGAPDSVMFEFLNEPNGEMTNRKVDEMNRVLLTRARSLHPDRWIIVGGSGWGHFEGLSKSRPPYDRRVMTTFHFYAPFEFTHQGATWLDMDLPTGMDWGSAEDRAEITKTFDAVVDWRDRTGMPVFLGEFGVYTAAPADARARWTSFVRASAEARDIGWCHWDWATAFRVYDLETESWIAPMRDALITPPPPIRSRDQGPRP